MLDNEIRLRTKFNPFPPLFEGTSVIKEGIERLGAATDLVKLNETSIVSESDRALQAEIDSKLTMLKAQDVDKRRRELGLVRQALVALKAQISNVEAQYSNEYSTTLKTALDGHRELQAAVDREGLNQFASDKFQGVGSPEWKAFLQSASNFSQTLGANYPQKEGDHCVFCRQDLSAAAVELIERYWDFLKGERAAKLKASEASLTRFKEALKSLSHKCPDQDSPLVTWISAKDSGFISELEDYFGCRETEASAFLDCIERLEWKSISRTTGVDLQRLDRLLVQLDEEVKNLNVDNVAKEVAQLQGQLTLLKHRSKLAEHHAEIEAYALTCKWVEAAKTFKRKFSTKPITDIQKKIHDELLSRQYIQVFHQECAKLKAPYKIDLGQKGSGGKTLRYLSVEGIQSGQVLSEGEQRAIALADFFTEIEMSRINGGIIFDDPVNSLDHYRREIIARRLADAAKNRQVVVFTHDLSFICDLRHAAEEAGVSLDGHWIDKRPDMQNFETGVVHLDRAPVSERDYLDPTEAERCLQDANRSVDPRDKARAVRDGMSSLRSSYEAFILLELFAGTVTRFDKQINHSKFEHAFVPPAFVEIVCKKLKYLSGFVEAHLHSDRSVGAQSSPEFLSQEIREFQEMKGRYRTEKKQAASA